MLCRVTALLPVADVPSLAATCWHLRRVCDDPLAWHRPHLDLTFRRSVLPWT